MQTLHISQQSSLLQDAKNSPVSFQQEKMLSDIDEKQKIIEDLTLQLSNKIALNKKIQKIAKSLDKNKNIQAAQESAKKSVRNLSKKIRSLTESILQKQEKEAKIQMKYITEMKELLNEGKEFRVLVCGIQSSGKSTFLNACMGQELLPGSQLGQTKHLLPIKYQKEGQAILREFNTNTLAYNPVTQQFSAQEIQDKIIENDSKDESKQKLYELNSNFKFLDNLPNFFKNKFVFIDSPGFNTTNLQQWQSLIGDHLERKFDFVILCLGLEQVQDPNYQAAIKLFFQKETVKNAIEKQQLIIVVNRYDQEKLYSRDQLTKKISKEINNLCNNGTLKPKICVVSAQRSLLAKIMCNQNISVQDRVNYSMKYFNDIPTNFREMVVESIVQVSTSDYNSSETYQQSYFDEFEQIFIQQIYQIFDKNLNTYIETIQTFLTGFDVRSVYQSLSKNPDSLIAMREFQTTRLTQIQEDYNKEISKLIQEINKKFAIVQSKKTYEKAKQTVVENFSFLIEKMPLTIHNFINQVQNEFKTLINFDVQDAQVKLQIQNFHNYQLNIAEVLLKNETTKFLSEKLDSDMQELFKEASSLLSMLSRNEAKWGYLVAQTIIATTNLPLFVASLFGGALMFTLSYNFQQQRLQILQEKCAGQFKDVISNQFSQIFVQQFDEFIKDNQNLINQIMIQQKTVNKNIVQQQQYSSQNSNSTANTATENIDAGLQDELIVFDLSEIMAADSSDISILNNLDINLEDLKCLQGDILEDDDDIELFKNF